MIHPYYKRLIRPEAIPASSSQPWSVPGVCRSYGWPARSAPGGGKIGVIELGGGYLTSDVQKFCSRIRQPVPTIVDVSVDQGATNNPGVSDADGEVALDIQVAAASYFEACGKPAMIRMYWAAQDLGAIARAIAAAAADGCATISISWGADEAEWGNSAAQALQAAAIAATTKGSTIFAASGDNDSSDGGPGAANVDLPASAPNIVGCGGTNRPRNSNPSTNPETVWNNNPGNADGEGTGGGFSTIFAIPPWQAAPAGPAAIHGRRMVPDVAANADPMTGYHIILDGQDVVVGGTSAVAPLYAGLFATFGSHLGQVNPTLWANEAMFRDITHGNNGLYNALVGPDPCTGLGTPYGEKLLRLFLPS